MAPLREPILSFNSRPLSEGRQTFLMELFPFESVSISFKGLYMNSVASDQFVHLCSLIRLFKVCRLSATGIEKSPDIAQIGQWQGIMVSHWNSMCLSASWLSICPSAFSFSDDNYLILWRSGLELLLGKFPEFLLELSACHTSVFSFPDDNE